MWRVEALSVTLRVTPLPEGEASVHIFVYVHITKLFFAFIAKKCTRTAKKKHT